MPGIPENIFGGSDVAEYCRWDVPVQDRLPCKTVKFMCMVEAPDNLMLQCLFAVLDQFNRIWVEEESVRTPRVGKGS